MAIQRVTQFALLLATVAFLVMGLQGWFAPVAFFRRVGIQLLEPSSLSEVRTGYGGLFNGCAVLFAYAAFREELRDVGLWLVTMISGGFVIGRIISLILDGVPNTFSLVLTAAEVGAFVFGLVLIVLRKRA